MRADLPPEARLDAAFGTATDRRITELDASEAFPAELCAELDAFGLSAHYVPAEWGGAPDDHEVLLRLLRTVARRDLTTGVAHAKSYLGAACVWIAGTAQQMRTTATAVLGGSAVAWALSEPDHGADLLHGDVVAVRGAGGYRLDGVKWPVNNATRADRLTVLARTGNIGTARGHSLFLVDKRELLPGTLRLLPKVPIHGIRGIDLSGAEFMQAQLPADALLGPEGAGVETVLRALQLTRTMCTALSLGAGEHALRLTARFTATRVIQNRPLAGRPYPASILGRGAALIAAVEAGSLVGARSIHTLTPEMSVTSSTVKALAPTLVDAVIAELAELLGARSFLTGVYQHGAFQKLARDHQIVSLFDGSTPVVRAALITQFPRLVRGFATELVDAEGLAEAVSVGQDLPGLDRSALNLQSRPGCSVVQSLPALVASLSGPSTPAGVHEHAVALSAATAQLHERMAGVPAARHPAMAAFELAVAYELCFAGAASLHLWAAHEHRLGTEPLWQDGLWIRATLRALRSRLAQTLRSPAPDLIPGDDAIESRLGQLVAELASAGAAVTPFGIPVPESTSDTRSTETRSTSRTGGARER